MAGSTSHSTDRPGTGQSVHGLKPAVRVEQARYGAGETRCSVAPVPEGARLSMRIRQELSELRERRLLATSSREWRELTTWIDEAYGELDRAIKLERAERGGAI